MMAQSRSSVGFSSELPAQHAPSRLGGAPPAGRCRHLFLAELLFADSGSERRWSSGGRGDRWCADADVGFAGSSAALVPAPLERSQLRGHRQQIGKSAAPAFTRLPSLAQRAARERSAETGSVDVNGTPLARARRPTATSEVGQQTDPRHLVEPPGRRAACWPLSPSLFSGIVVRGFRFGATMELGRSGRSMVRPMLTSASPGRRRRWCRRRSSAASYGVIGNRSENLQHRRSPACLRSRNAAAARKDQRKLAALTLMAPHSRARGAAATSEVGQQTDPRHGRAAGGAPCWPRRHFFLAELLFADSGSERRWSSGGRGDRW